MLPIFKYNYTSLSFSFSFLSFFLSLPLLPLGSGYQPTNITDKVTDVNTYRECGEASSTLGDNNTVPFR